MYDKIYNKAMWKYHLLQNEQIKNCVSVFARRETMM
jgi:hypothetical protein